MCRTCHQKFQVCICIFHSFVHSLIERIHVVSSYKLEINFFDHIPKKNLFRNFNKNLNYTPIKKIHRYSLFTIYYLCITFCKTLPFLSKHDLNRRLCYNAIKYTLGEESCKTRINEMLLEKVDHSSCCSTYN